MLLSLLKKLQKLKKLLLKLEKKQKKLTRKRWKKRLNFPREKSHGLRTVGFFILGLMSVLSGQGGLVRRLTTAINRLLETHFPTLFHTASSLSAPSGHLPRMEKAIHIKR